MTDFAQKNGADSVGSTGPASLKKTLKVRRRVIARPIARLRAKAKIAIRHQRQTALDRRQFLDLFVAHGRQILDERRSMEGAADNQHPVRFVSLRQHLADAT